MIPATAYPIKTIQLRWEVDQAFLFFTKMEQRMVTINATKAMSHAKFISAPAA
jgi:hypothetical protein